MLIKKTHGDLVILGDQITVIKPINREEHQEPLDEIQAAISHNLLHLILILRALWVRKWKRNTMESRETREKVSRQLN